MLTIVMSVSLFIAAGALAMTLWNLSFFRRPVATRGGGRAPRVFVCIPARNEEANIEACVRSVLASAGADIRVLVYDDQSEDGTPLVLARLCESDERVARVPTRPLPQGWIGKQWACQRLGEAALERGADWLLFVDADVRLRPACVHAAVGEAERLRAGLLSTFPRQVTGTLAEALVVPMIHFVLLSYLPFVLMRRTNRPSASAACGQFILVSGTAYRAMGGHEGCRGSMHDGVMLPRLARAAGAHTDLFDGTELAECRMYSGAAAVWRGFTKNAYEGLGSPVVLWVFTVFHALGHVLPWLVLGAAVAGLEVGAWVAALALSAALVNLAQRVILAIRFRQPWIGVALHPIGVLAMTVIQWQSWLLHATGRRSWKGRGGAGAPSGAGLRVGSTT